MSYSYLKRVLIILFLVANYLTAASAQEQLRISGTGGMLAVMDKLASEFQRSHPEIAVTILPSIGSSGGIKAVLAGQLDLGLSSRQLKTSEQGAAAQVIGSTSFVFAVHRDTTVSDLTLEEIEALYANRTERWPKGHPVRVVLRPKSEYDTELLKSMSPGMERAVSDAQKREGMIIAVTDQDNADAIETIPGAIGTITLGQILSEGRPFKTISLNGIRPAKIPSTSRAYPYTKTYYLITKPDAAPAVRTFREFIFSDAGRSILNRFGYETSR